jgi:hypothetical protein
METRRAKIETMVKQGKTLDEIKAALPDAPAPPPAAPPAGAPGAGGGQGAPAGAGRGPGGGGRGPQPTYTDLAYQELTKK